MGVPCCCAIARSELIGETGWPRCVRKGAVTNAATLWRVSYSARNVGTANGPVASIKSRIFSFQVRSDSNSANREAIC